MMIEDTIELFQNKYRTRNGSGDDDNDLDIFIPVMPVVFPSNWRKRVKRSGTCYTYSRQEIMEYNEMVYLHGKNRATQWANRRWHERSK